MILTSLVKMDFVFRVVAGVIKRELLGAFERVLWRVCRGNVFLKHADIEEPLTDPATVGIEYG